MLRAWYALVTVLMMGFLLIFCLQVLLFLFVSLVMEGGLSSKQSLNVFHLLGVIFSIPIFIYGLSSALTMASEFVMDTWEGHTFFRTILRWSSVFIDWYCFIAFLGIPICVMMYEMFVSEHFWERTALTWFACVTFTYCIFCLGVFVFEIWGALELLSHHPDHGLIDLHIRRVGKFLKRAILLRQLHSYCGVRNRTFFIEGGSALPTANDSYDQSELADHEYSAESISLYSRFTQRMPDNWFYEYERPKRQFNIEDVLDREVFVTGMLISLWLFVMLFAKKISLTLVLCRRDMELGKAVLPSQEGSQCRRGQWTFGNHQRPSHFQFLVRRPGKPLVLCFLCGLGALGRGIHSHDDYIDGHFCFCQPQCHHSHLLALRFLP